MLAITRAAAGTGEVAILCGAGVAAPGEDALGALGEGAAVSGEGVVGLGSELATPVAGCSAAATSSAATATGTSSANTRARPPAAMMETNDRPCMCVFPPN